MPKGPKTVRWSNLERHQQFALLCTLAGDLELARQAIVLSERHGADEGNHEQRLLFGCIAETAVIRYARAFSICNLVGGRYRAKVDHDALTAEFDEREGTLHRMVMRMRDSTIAHSDHGVRSTIILRTGDGIATRSTSYWPTDEELAALRIMITKVVGVVSLLIEELAAHDDLVRRSGVQIASTVAEFEMGINRLPFGEFD